MRRKDGVNQSNSVESNHSEWAISNPRRRAVDLPRLNLNRQSQTSTSSTSPGDKQTLPTVANWERPDITLGLTPFSFDMYLSEDKQETSNNSMNSSEQLQPPWIQIPPRSNWAVQDNKLKPRPSLFPPMIPSTSTYIGDASPSVIAVRIAECLRKNNAIVEYDDEAATANVYTIDRVWLSVTLYRGGKGILESHHRAAVDLSHGVLIECIRIQGDTVSFHRICWAIFSSARGESDGLDYERRKHACFQDSPLGRCPMTDMLDSTDTSTRGASSLPTWNPRFYLFQPKFLNSTKMDNAHVASTTIGTLSKALSLLEKDRHDAQTLGLQLLVMLTDTFCSRIQVAVYSSLCVMGAPLHDRSSRTQMDPSTLHRIHDWIFALLTRREEIGSSSSLKSNKKVHDDNLSEWSLEHIVSLRTLALRVFTNALSVLVMHDSAARGMYPSFSHSSPRLDAFWAKPFLQISMEDIRGAGRPPHPLLGNSNEAAILVRFLRLILTYSKDAKQRMIEYEGLHNALDRAYMIGMSSHRSLEDESIKLLQMLSK